MGCKQDRICVCENCYKTFDYYDSVIKKSCKTSGADITQRECPYCGGYIRLLQPPRYFDKYLDVNNDPRYYS